MTDQTTENGGPSLSFEKVPAPSRSERAPVSSPVPDKADASLAFEATPRAPVPAAPATPRSAGAAATRALVADALAGATAAEPGHHAFQRAPAPAPANPDPAPGHHAFQAVPASAPAISDPGSKPHAFQAVPASAPVGVAQRMSTATIGFRPQAAEVTSVSSPGGQGWNIRSQDAESTTRGRAEPIVPAWSPRTTPAKNKDRSAWDVPAAPRSRHPTGRGVVGVFLTLVLVAILGFAVYAYLTGRGHSTTIKTPATVGTLAPIATPAAAVVAQQMKQVMLASGATQVVSGVYGVAGRPTLVVLLAQGPDIATTSTQFFNDFSSGLQRDGVTVDKTRTVKTVTDGSQFVCSAATRPAPQTAVSLCGWSDGSTIGLVMDVSGEPVNKTLTEAVQAKTAGEH
ncbi:MAG TPA: hypothetical protein VND88_03010 [Candidatus Acidoferrales bacterium]|nr:hypothetical protein [Candidatus Acidoferrales bacterium]